MRTLKRRFSKVNSGWHCYIHPELGKIWGSRHRNNGVFVRKIFFSLRSPKRRYNYELDERRATRVIKVGRYFEYMKAEWGVTHFMHSITRNLKFKRWLEKRH